MNLVRGDWLHRELSKIFDLEPQVLTVHDFDERVFVSFFRHGDKKTLSTPHNIDVSGHERELLLHRFTLMLRRYL